MLMAALFHRFKSVLRVCPVPAPSSNAHTLIRLVLLQNSAASFVPTFHDPQGYQTEADLFHSFLSIIHDFSRNENPHNCMKFTNKIL